MRIGRDWLSVAKRIRMGKGDAGGVGQNALDRGGMFLQVVESAEAVFRSGANTASRIVDLRVDETLTRIDFIDETILKSIGSRACEDEASRADRLPAKAVHHRPLSAIVFWRRGKGSLPLARRH